MFVPILLLFVSIVQLVKAGSPNYGFVSTFAGTDNTITGESYGGDGGPATSASLNTPSDVALDGLGGIYVCDSANHIIRFIDSSYDIETVAGIPEIAGYNGDGGQATSATLNAPFGITYSKTYLKLYVADTLNHRVRLIDLSAGLISTVAGTGSSGNGGVGEATSCALNNPTSVSLDPDRNIYIADKGNHCIRKITTAGGGTTITTVAGLCGTSGSTTGDGTSARLFYPYYIYSDSNANSPSLYIADSFNHVIRRLYTKLSSGNMKVVAGRMLSPAYFGDGGAPTSAKLYYPLAISVDNGGSMIISDSYNNVIRKATNDSTPIIYTIVGDTDITFDDDSSVATSSSLNLPAGTDYDSTGIWLCDSNNNRIRKITFAPSFAPTARPTVGPTVTPSFKPTHSPTVVPSVTPTKSPSYRPTPSPTNSPTYAPSRGPTTRPTYVPTAIPSTVPTKTPSFTPTSTPTFTPTFVPTKMPSFIPTSTPTFTPSTTPTKSPSFSPSSTPSYTPSFTPSRTPSTTPSSLPTALPTPIPTATPSTANPSKVPSTLPTIYVGYPTPSPSTATPTIIPTAVPTAIPTAIPTVTPTAVPTAVPTAIPSATPTVTPTDVPTAVPTVIPTNEPSFSPTYMPTVTPTDTPSFSPSIVPTVIPTAVPTVIPTETPTVTPTDVPTAIPTTIPTPSPTGTPTSFPTSLPTSVPLSIPTGNPTSIPTSKPSSPFPTSQPSSMPSSQPTSLPTVYTAPGQSYFTVLIQIIELEYDGDGGWTSSSLSTETFLQATVASIPSIQQSDINILAVTNDDYSNVKTFFRPSEAGLRINYTVSFFDQHIEQRRLTTEVGASYRYNTVYEYLSGGLLESLQNGNYTHALNYLAVNLACDPLKNVTIWNWEIGDAIATNSLTSQPSSASTVKPEALVSQFKKYIIIASVVTAVMIVCCICAVYIRYVRRKNSKAIGAYARWNETYNDIRNSASNFINRLSEFGSNKSHHEQGEMIAAAAGGNTNNPLQRQKTKATRKKSLYLPDTANNSGFDDHKSNLAARPSDHIRPSLLYSHYSDNGKKTDSNPMYDL